jgi:sec-independent protein translocase protein TatA
MGFGGVVMSLLGFFRPGFWELVIILLIVLLLFGAAKLPQIGKAIGEAVKGFRESSKD